MFHTVEQLTRSQAFPESVGMKCKDFLLRAAIDFISTCPLISAISYCKAEEEKPVVREANRNTARLVPSFSMLSILCLQVTATLKYHQEMFPPALVMEPEVLMNRLQQVQDSLFI